MGIQKSQVITLSNNKEYLCLSIIMFENKKYLYLVTTTKPLEFCFVEETAINENGTKMRIVGSSDEKHKLFALLKAQAQADFNRGEHHV